MTLFVKAFQSTLENKDGKKQWYPRLVKMGKTVDARTLGRAISKRSSISVGDSMSMIEDMMDIMREYLLDGKSVCLDGLGTFTVFCRARSTGVDTEEEVNPKQITDLKVRFTPSYTRSTFEGTTRALFTGVDFQMYDKKKQAKNEEEEGGSSGGGQIDPDA